MEKTPKICGCGSGDFFRRQVSHTSKRTRYFRDIGGLVALAAIGLRGEEGRVRLDEDAVKGKVARNVANVLRFGISGVARKRNHESGIESALRLLERAGKTMQDAAEAGGAPDFFEELQAIGPGIAAMNDDGELGFAGQTPSAGEKLFLALRGENDRRNNRGRFRPRR